MRRFYCHLSKLGLWALLTLLAMTGCNTLFPGQATATPTSTAEPILMCTPPACEPGEVFHCEGDCPGGCGTVCATPTPEPILMCTPPACEPGEVFHCEGDCPGGCGTVCATPTPGVPGADMPPTDWEGLANWLTAAWQNNTNPAAVRTALQAAGWQRGFEDWHAADFDGDLQDEWILVLYQPGSVEMVFGAIGNLWIVNGAGVIYRYYDSVSPDTMDAIAPTVVGLADMTGDGRPELVTDATFCGAHTCFGNYQIISSVHGLPQNIVQRPPAIEGEPPNIITLSYPDTRFEDVTGDGQTDFLVHGGTIGSAGAGIVRPYTEVWAWDGTAVTLADTILDTTNYRHHILYEANQLMAEGDLAGALLLYERAINDNSLISYVYGPSETETYASISQFAAFRLILIDLLQGDSSRAAGRLAWLNQNYPGTAAAQGAATLVNNWSGPEGMAALCATIESNLQALPNPTGALADLGYGNPSLTAEDFCP